jgi:hypothetical protein
MAIFRCKLAALAVVLSASAYAEPTWNRDVSRIAQAKCQGCHRPNDIAPFPLMSYSDAEPRARLIKSAVGRRFMPPWKPVEGYGHFKGSYALTEEERQTILSWVDAGAPEGDAADAPEPPSERGTWQLGEPDQVVTMAEPYPVSMKRPDDYRCFVLDPRTTEDRHVSAVEVLPGNRQIVHHVILFIDGTGQADKLDAAEDGPGYTCFGGPGLDVGTSVFALLADRVGGLGGWVPGMRIRPLPENVGIFVPKGARIIMQVHYHPHAEADEQIEPDQTQFGIYYSKGKVEKRLRYVPVVNTTFRIPAGDPAHEVTAEFMIPPFFDAHAVQIVPHMHLLGREIKVEKIGLRGDKEPMVYINDWDFNWQGFYEYEEPMALKFPDRVKLTCLFDNSIDNPRNPNSPPKVVGWGEGTEDEMCLAFIGVTLDSEKLQ